MVRTIVNGQNGGSAKTHRAFASVMLWKPELPCLGVGVVNGCLSAPAQGRNLTCLRDKISAPLPLRLWKRHSAHRTRRYVKFGQENPTAGIGASLPAK